MQTVAVLFGLVIAFTACAIGWTIARERRRQSGMSQAAVGLGLRPVADPEPWLRRTGLSQLPLFALAELGGWVRVSNVFEGELGGTPVALCDYTRATGTAGRRVEVHETAACLPVEAGRLPEFVLEPERPGISRAGLARALGVFGAATWLAPASYRQAIGVLRANLDEPGVAFDDDPAFAQRYRLLSPDPGRAKRAFGPAVRRLLRDAEDGALAVQSRGNWLVVFRPNRLISPDRMRAFLDEAVGVERLLLQGAGTRAN